MSKAVPALTLAPNLHPQGFIRAPRPSSLPKNPTPAHPNRHPSSQAAPAPSPGSQQPLWLPRVLTQSTHPPPSPHRPVRNPATSPATSPRRCHRQPCQRILPGRRPAHRLPCRQHCHCRHPTSPPPLQSVTLAIPTPATPVCPPSRPEGCREPAESLPNQSARLTPAARNWTHSPPNWTHRPRKWTHDRRLAPKLDTLACQGGHIPVIRPFWPSSVEPALSLSSGGSRLLRLRHPGVFSRDPAPTTVPGAPCHPIHPCHPNPRPTRSPIAIPPIATCPQTMYTI